MPRGREELLRTLVAPVSAAILVLAFFAIFDRWQQLGDPINSIVTVALGLVGFVVGATLDRLRARRGQMASSSTPDTPSA